MNSLEFARLLAHHGVVQADAVEHPEAYDHCVTLDRIRGAWAVIDKGIRQRIEHESIAAVRNALDEALNSGDGSYRP